MATSKQRVGPDLEDYALKIIEVDPATGNPKNDLRLDAIAEIKDWSRISAGRLFEIFDNFSNLIDQSVELAAIHSLLEQVLAILQADFSSSVTSVNRKAYVCNDFNIVNAASFHVTPDTSRKFLKVINIGGDGATYPNLNLCDVVAAVSVVPSEIEFDYLIPPLGSAVADFPHLGLYVGAIGDSDIGTGYIAGHFIIIEGF